MQELVDAVGAAQQNVSQHLGILHRAGFLTRHRQGTSVRYELADQRVLRLFDDTARLLAREET